MRGIHKSALTALVLLAMGFGPFAYADDPIAAAAKDPNLFLEVAAKELKWREPAEPLHVAGPIHFVGTQGLGAWLITTSEGHIILNSGMPGSGPMIENSIRKLGFKPSDVKYLLTCHAHVDHVGGHAYLKKVTGAKVVLMKTEVELLQSGGKSDFHYGSAPAFAFDAVKVDRPIGDSDEVKLGGVTLIALHTPGHTRGSTTWTMTVTEGGQKYKVVFPDGTSVNPGYRVTVNPSYPGIADDFRHTFRVLETLKPDIWLRPHNDTSKIEARRAASKGESARIWVDPQGYRDWVKLQHGKFDAVVASEKASTKAK